MEIAARLEGKGTIPMVAQQMELILELQTEGWWAGINLPLLEDVRLRAVRVRAQSSSRPIS